MILEPNDPTIVADTIKKNFWHGKNFNYYQVLRNGIKFIMEMTLNIALFLKYIVLKNLFRFMEKRISDIALHAKTEGYAMTGRQKNNIFI